MYRLFILLIATTLSAELVPFFGTGYREDSFHWDLVDPAAAPAPADINQTMQFNANSLKTINCAAGFDWYTCHDLVVNFTANMGSVNSGNFKRTDFAGDSSLIQTLRGTTSGTVNEFKFSIASDINICWAILTPRIGIYYERIKLNLKNAELTKAAATTSLFGFAGRNRMRVKGPSAGFNLELVPCDYLTLWGGVDAQSLSFRNKVRFNLPTVEKHKSATVGKGLTLSSGVDIWFSKCWKWSNYGSYQHIWLPGGTNKRAIPNPLGKGNLVRSSPFKHGKWENWRANSTISYVF